LLGHGKRDFIRHLLNVCVPAPFLTLSGAHLNLTIFLDDKSLNSLKESIPTGSRSKVIIENALQLKGFGSDAVVTCDAAEARNLFLYAGHCPSVVAAIRKALRVAGLPLDR